MPDTTPQSLIRHTLGTLSYRLGKVLRDTPDTFGDYPHNGDERTAVRILAHINDLMDGSLRKLTGNLAWQDSEPLNWTREIERFYQAIAALDARIASSGLGDCAPERLFQGPIADAFTHTGQLAMMRRLAGISIKGENYYLAEISTGTVGPAQAAPRREF